MNPEPVQPPLILLVSSELTEQKSQFKISMQTPVENPLMTIESFNRQFQVGEKEREAVDWGWEQEMGNTMFHVVNAYTRAPFSRLADEPKATALRW